MKLTEQDLRRLVQTAEKNQAQTRGRESAPVDGDFIARAAAGELDDAERARLPGLMAHNPELVKELALAVELHQGIDPGPSQPATVPRRHLLAMAASMVMAVTAMLWYTSQSSAPADEPPVLRSQTEQVQPADGARLATQPSTFSWEPRSLSNRYRVQVLRPSGEQIWQSDWVEGTTLSPKDLELEPGDYLWRVIARDDTSPGLVPGYAFSVAP